MLWGIAMTEDQSKVQLVEKGKLNKRRTKSEKQRKIYNQ
jgi:hypothetical protein